MKSLGLSLLNESKTIRNSHLKPAFTIVELLVVIVVIGILAAVTIVSYTGITNRAMLASLSSDLDGASRQLKLFQTINGSYPTTISLNCATTPDTTTNKCLKLSPGNTINSLTGDYSVNNTTSPQTFSLTIKNTSSSTLAVITDNSRPAVLTPAPMNPVADWLATYQGDHYGNFYDSVTHSYATVTRTTSKTVYDQNTQHIYDVPANYLAITPRSDGKSGSEAVIEEGRTNYLLNSYGATNTNGGWNSWEFDNWTTGAPSTSISATSIYGNTAQRITYAGSSSDSGSATASITNSASGTFSAGDAATGSVWMKGASSGVTIQVVLVAYNSSNTYLGEADSSTIVLSSSWQRVTTTYTNLPTNTTFISFWIRTRYIDNGDTYDMTFSAAQLEKGAFATSYIPTTTTAVTRNADVVTVPTTSWSQSTGTYFIISGMSITYSGCRHRLTWNVSNYDTFFNRNCSGSDEDTYANNTTAYISGYATGTLGYHTYVGSYASSNPTKSYRDGTLKSQSSSAISPSSTILSTITSATIGTYSGSTFNYNDSIQRVTVYSSALSDTDILSVTNAIKDGP